MEYDLILASIEVRNRDRNEEELKIIQESINSIQISEKTEGNNF